MIDKVLTIPAIIKIAPNITQPQKIVCTRIFTVFCFIHISPFKSNKLPTRLTEQR